MLFNVKMNETEHTNPSKDLHQPVFFFTLKQLDDPVLSGSGIGSSLFKLLSERTQ